MLDFIRRISMIINLLTGGNIFLTIAGRLYQNKDKDGWNKVYSWWNTGAMDSDHCIKAYATDLAKAENFAKMRM